MSSTVHFELTGSLPDLDAAMHKLAAAAVAKAAFAIEAEAKAHAPVDTGALKASISAITAGEDHSGVNYIVAQAFNPGATLADAPQVESDLEAIVAVPMSYAAYLEYGTAHMPARPFLTPAVEAIQPELEQALAELGGELEQAIFQDFAPKGGAA